MGIGFAHSYNPEAKSYNPPEGWFRGICLYKSVQYNPCCVSETVSQPARPHRSAVFRRCCNRRPAEQNRCKTPYCSFSDCPQRFHSVIHPERPRSATATQDWLWLHVLSYWYIRRIILLLPQDVPGSVHVFFWLININYILIFIPQHNINIICYVWYYIY